MVFVTAKLKAPSIGPSSPIRNAVSAKAATLMSSRKTNMLKRSPVYENPTAPPRKSRTRTWKCVPTTSKKRHEYTSAADENAREHRDRGPERVDRERDAERDAVARAPVSEPV